VVEHATEVKLLSRLFELRDAKTTSLASNVRRQSTRVYTELGHFEREVSKLFREAPLVAGLSCDVPRSGDFFTVELGAIAVIVVRGEDGGVQAFLNACRHRGARVAQGCGRAQRVFRCPYHGWVYDIDGRLLGQPVAKDGFAGLDPERTGLIELPAAEACGLVFVTPAPAAGPIDVEQVLAGMSGELCEHGFDTWALVGERAGAWQMNWKMCFPRFLGDFRTRFDFESLEEGSLQWQRTGSTPMSCVNAQCGYIVSPIPSR
jgi:phenylpropionate dioxygenase-like ring-hydroxylating dioxygenase large terminal subunit